MSVNFRHSRARHNSHGRCGYNSYKSLTGERKLAKVLPQFSRADVIRLWLHRQGLLTITPSRKLTAKTFTDHLQRTGGLQVDSVNVVDRAHYLTLWSRFGSYNRATVDKWVYRDRLAYEYWGHEASILPISHLPHGMRRMRRFPPDRWKDAAYWERFDTSPESKRRVMRLLKQAGPLESADFERTPEDLKQQQILGWGSILPKEDKRSLQLLWHAGKVAICDRKHFRKFYDVAERIYPKVQPSTLAQYHDTWWQLGLSGCGIAPESHLVNYITGPNLKADERAKSLGRNLRTGKIVEVRMTDSRQRCFALPELLEGIDQLPAPQGLTLICPFDSLLWQRKRAEELLGFRYRVEIYVPEKKREFGYYVLPILWNGNLVGRLDPKLHRDQERLEIKAVYLEEGFKDSISFQRLLRTCVEDLASFLKATRVDWPTGNSM